MKVRICYTVEVSPEYRRRLNAYYGKLGHASRHELKEHFREYGGTLDDDLMADSAERDGEA